MKKSIQISIPTPCHENWDAMTGADKGRFCTSCQKTVLDFTKSSDREIALVLKNTENACGRFRTAQLDRDLVLPKEKSSLWMAASAAIVSFLTIGNHEILAKVSVATEQIELRKIDSINNRFQVKVISGIVLDVEGNLIPNALVKLKISKKEVITKPDGSFSIEANVGDKIIIKFPGFEESNTIIGVKNEYEIVLQHKINEDDIIIMGYSTKQRTFFGNIFHSIGNIFR